MLSMAQLSPKKKVLLTQSLSDFDARWDESASLLRSREDGQDYHGVRESVFYALALLIRQGEGDIARADRILRRVLSLQLNCPGQIWHGTFAISPEAPVPVRACIDVGELTPLARWQWDVMQERFGAALRARLLGDSALREHLPAFLDCLEEARKDVFPLVWKTYDPNWREFILSSMALILEHFEALLPRDTVSAMDRAAREGLAGARFRAESDLTPMNTNVKVMHTFLFDAFGRRFGDQALLDYAAAFADRFVSDYECYHAVAEFNSPTYNGVVLSYTGFLRDRGGSSAVRRMGAVLEEGLWRDLADFYNPSLGTLAGPFSRAYGLTAEGTALPMLMYLGLEDIPVEEAPPFGGETESASVLCCGTCVIPEDVKPLLRLSRGERKVSRSFRELAERGRPGNNDALCHATAWITDDLMAGALSGSRNTSHQLHAAVVHWRDAEGGVSGLRLRRRASDGSLVHLRTALLDCTAAPGKLEGTVRNETAEEILCDFEFESPGAARGAFSKELWQVNGLRCVPSLTVLSPEGGTREAEAAPLPQAPDILWLRIPLPVGCTLRFSLDLSLARQQSDRGTD